MKNIHLNEVSCQDLGEVTLLVGDPARVHLIGSSLQQVRTVTENRELILISGQWLGKTVSVCSTGMGVGSTEIAVVELIASGAKRLVRVGGCGSWSDTIQAGDLMINHGMAREQGMLSAYAPDYYPACADPYLLNAILQQAQREGFVTHTGIGLTAQGYYLSQGRHPNIVTGPQPTADVMSYWQTRHITNCDMESAVIFLLASLYQVPAANCLVVHLSRTCDQRVADIDYARCHKSTAEMVLNACILPLIDALEDDHYATAI